jgi:hypothetical protein
MSRQTDKGMGSCCAPEIKGNRYLIFPDGCRIGVRGLDGIFDDAYRERKKPDRSVANELVLRLSENNYIPLVAWSEYEEVVLKEYRRFHEAKEKV